MSYAEHGSFKFGNTDMYDKFGIMIVDSGMPEDLFIPSIRERKTTVPNRHGVYDFGAEYYNERELTLKCIAAEPYRMRITMENIRHYVREITYVLSKKSTIYLWNEPDKYYIGRLYDSTELIQLRNLADEFSLTFICEPFAYGRTVKTEYTSSAIAINYKGTAPTPTYIRLTNTGTNPITSISIRQTILEDNL